eukprot:CAMPEP_0119322132 /NCGR_PEP_ID=MMETSP1333-20130426/57358_1 /TAXON_ID=418940 /ORGANISM="Scyphosphaera apsteinii, Strain RCC1455" /LENGTH=310 /DNA_ID=CAMNT_0007329279 /DNA_START=13 /DNA_END=945 /DNA_ORIENTATION=+
MEIGGQDGLTSPLVASESETVTQRGEAVAAEALQRKRLGGMLWRVGVFLRLLTIANAFGLLGAVGYLLWLDGYVVWPHTIEPTVPSVASVRTALRYGTPAACGLLLLLVESATASAERSTRLALGCLFGPSGRFWLLFGAALLTLQVFDWEHSFMQLIVSGGAVGVTICNALLQAWILACVPSFRKHVVCELLTSQLAVDSSSFPQIYQRDDGARLHLGVLLPGFSTRDHLTMTLNVSEIELIGEIKALEAPFGTPVDKKNALAGPFGPFQRKVRLNQPVDTSTPVEAEMKHGIVEFRFLKGYAPPESLV